jgi:hypothetical protein
MHKRSSIVKNVFETKASLRNYQEKMDEIRMDASIHACVSLCQCMSACVRYSYVKFLCCNNLILIHRAIDIYTTSR